MSAEEGEIRCDEIGVCKSLMASVPCCLLFLNWFLPALDVVEFDNGFSFLRSKKIWYLINVESASPIAQTNSDDLDHI